MTMLLLITVGVMIVEATKYLYNICGKHLTGFLKGLGSFTKNFMNPSFDPAFNY